MARARTAAALLAGCLATAGAGVPARASTGSETRTIRWANGHVTQIGSLRTSGRVQPTIARAIAAFGRPSSTRRTSRITCVLDWSRLGLRASFANLGAIPPGQTICTPSVGLLGSASVRGRGFQTQRGLRVGDSTARLRRLHSGARFRQGTWWLATAPAVFGDVEPGERVPIVRALTQDGRVTRFVLSIGAAGE
jgi:hypothetical protein